MDISTVAGLILGFVAIIGSILYGSPISIFVDIPSIFVVCGGVIATTLIKWPMEDVKLLIRYYMKAIFSKPTDLKALIAEIGGLADLARKESILKLESAPASENFLKTAMILASANKPGEVIASQLSLEVTAMEERHTKGIDMLDGIGADGPAFGMIGTLIGLVQMLQNMSDPSAIGPAMAVALLTTFYGAVIANVLSIPVAAKLKQRSKQEAFKMNLIITGILGIVAGENRNAVTEKLESFFPEAERTKKD